MSRTRRLRAMRFDEVPAWMPATSAGMTAESELKIHPSSKVCVARHALVTGRVEL